MTTNPARATRLLALLVALPALQASTAAPAGARTVVLPFVSPNGSVTAAFAESCAQAAGQILAATGLDVADPAAVAQALSAAGLRRAATGDDAACARAAATALHAGQVVEGVLTATVEGRELRTTLWEFPAGRAVRRARSLDRSASLPADALLRANLARLLPALPAATAQAPAPAVGPAAPKRPSSPAARPGTGELSSPWTVVGDAVSDRLVLGARLNTVSLDQTSKKYYVGTIDRLVEEDSAWLSPFVQFYFLPWLGVEAGWADVGARAFAESADSHSDGVVTASGPELSLLLRGRLDRGLALVDPSWAAACPWAARVEPYMGLGLAFMSGAFEHDLWYILGYPSPVLWEADGRPTESESYRIRSVSAGDDTGLVLTLGAAVQVYRGWELDLMYRHVSAELPATHYYPYNTVRGTGSFDLSHSLFAIGVQYRF